MNWVQRNFKAIIYISFLVPILTVAFVSISHVTSWYGLSNPVSWSIYLSVGIEIAALSALAAISAQMGAKVYFPFGIVTLIQFIGNIFFAYQYIDINSQALRIGLIWLTHWFHTWELNQVIMLVIKDFYLCLLVECYQ